MLDSNRDSENNINKSAVTSSEITKNEEESQSESLIEKGDSEIKSKEEGSMKRDGMESIHISAYSVGHFCNDLCASMWFTYLLWFVNQVVGLTDTQSGYALLSGQLTDGITTPVVGLLSDKLNCIGGKRNFWYTFGTILVVPTFLGIFLNPGFLQPPTHATVIWYCTLPALFNVGWASVQIAHLAIVNQLSYGQRRRDLMVNNRNGFTYAANILVLTTALILFGTVDNSTLQFRILGVMCIGIGMFTNVFYLCLIRENKLSRDAIHYDKQYKIFLMGDQYDEETERLKEEQKKANGKSVKDWLGEGQFYIFGLVYMLARISMNVTASVMPFYLQTVTGFVATDDQPTPIQIAIVPLISYITSLIYSLFFQQKLTQHYRNRLIPILFSVVISGITAFPFMFMDTNPSNNWLVYPTSAVQGVGLAIQLNSATSLISDVIGQDNTSGAFVYGAYSFFDKFANGFILFAITSIWISDATALRYIISLTSFICASLLAILTYIGQRYYASRLTKISTGSKMARVRANRTQQVKQHEKAEQLMDEDNDPIANASKNTYNTDEN